MASGSREVYVGMHVSVCVRACVRGQGSEVLCYSRDTFIHTRQHDERGTTGNRQSNYRHLLVNYHVSIASRLISRRT